MFNTNWKWPKVEDVCWYPEEDVKIAWGIVQFTRSFEKPVK